MTKTSKHHHPVAISARWTSSSREAIAGSDYRVYYQLLLEHLVLATVIDEGGDVVATLFSTVPDLTEQVVQDLTVWVAEKIIEEVQQTGSLQLSCTGIDLCDEFKAAVWALFASREVISEQVVSEAEEVLH